MESFMKKLCLLSGMIVLSAVANIHASDVKNPGGLKEKHRQRIEDVQHQKIARQRQLARPPVYTMIDALIKEGSAEYNEGELVVKPIIINWSAVFNILDSMRGVIDVNEYITYDNGYPLLYVAVKEGDVLAAKTLLEKYKANPNILADVLPFSLVDFEAGKSNEMTPLMLARKQGDNAMVNLLIKHGAKK